MVLRPCCFLRLPLVPQAGLGPCQMIPEHPPASSFLKHSCLQNGRHATSLSLRWPCPHVCDSQKVCCAIFKPWEFAWILIHAPNCTYWTTLFNCFTPVYLPRNVIIIYKILLKNMFETVKYFTLKIRFKKKIKRSKIDKGKENKLVVGHTPHL